MEILFHDYAKYVAVGGVLISLLLVLRAFTINAQSGRRRFGWKSVSFVVLTLGLVVAIRTASGYRVENAYKAVAKANTAVMADDTKYRASQVAFKTSFEAYAESLDLLQPDSDIRSDLIAIGKIAGRTRVLGESLQTKYEELVQISETYQATLLNATDTYQFAQSSLKQWATEKDALQHSSKVIKELANNEEFQEISDAYVELAEVFAKLSQTNSTRLQEIEVNLPALDDAMTYVRSANQYLATVEQHATILGAFQSPSEILNDVQVYQQGVEKVMRSIHEVNRRLDNTDVTFLQTSI